MVRFGSVLKAKLFNSHNKSVSDNCHEKTPKKTKLKTIEKILKALKENENISLEFATLFETVEVNGEQTKKALVGISDDKLIIVKHLIISRQKYRVSVFPMKINSFGIQPSRIFDNEVLTIMNERTQLIFKYPYQGEYMKLKTFFSGINTSNIGTLKVHDSLWGSVSRNSFGFIGRGTQSAQSFLKEPIVANGFIASAIGFAGIYATTESDSKTIAGDAKRYVDNEFAELASDAGVEYAADEAKSHFFWDVLLPIARELV